MEKDIKQYLPVLTIVMPFYNQKELVAGMIESIIANDFLDWELLAIDDGASQETLDYLKKYEADKRIRIIKRTLPPKGAQTCRNMGLERARGEFIVFFDSDDYVTPQCLGTRVSHIRQHPECDFVVFPSGILKEQTFHAIAPEYIYGYPVYKNDVKSFSRRVLPFIVWNNIYRTESIRKKGLQWDTHLLSLQDADFNMQCLLNNMSYAYASTPPDYGYRIAYNTTSISRNIESQQQYQSHLYALDKFFREVQSRYGHQYDHALYQGVLYICNKVFRQRTNYSFAKELTQMVSSHNKWYGKRLQIQFKFSLFLEKILSPYRSRQIAMLPYLIRYNLRKVLVARQIRQLYMDQTSRKS